MVSKLQPYRFTQHVFKLIDSYHVRRGLFSDLRVPYDDMPYAIPFPVRPPFR